VSYWSTKSVFMHFKQNGITDSH